MKHIFIINPAAGKKNCTTELMEMAKKLEIDHGIETECILTKSVGHACETVRSIAQTGESVRFYACGGDGTLNEVITGVMNKKLGRLKVLNRKYIEDGNYTITETDTKAIPSDIFEDEVVLPLDEKLNPEIENY